MLAKLYTFWIRPAFNYCTGFPRVWALWQRCSEHCSVYVDFRFICFICFRHNRILYL